MKKTLTKEAKYLLSEALYLRLEQNGVTKQQERLLKSLISAMGAGVDTNIQWICN
jgi:hypothetical protein